jgi:hypothetical protein
MEYEGSSAGAIDLSAARIAIDGTPEKAATNTRQTALRSQIGPEFQLAS